MFPHSQSPRVFRGLQYTVFGAELEATPTTVASTRRISCFNSRVPIVTSKAPLLLRLVVNSEASPSDWSVLARQITYVHLTLTFAHVAHQIHPMTDPEVPGGSIDLHTFITIPNRPVRVRRATSQIYCRDAGPFSNVQDSKRFAHFHPPYASHSKGIFCSSARCQGNTLRSLLRISRMTWKKRCP